MIMASYCTSTAFVIPRKPAVAIRESVATTFTARKITTPIILFSEIGTTRATSSSNKTYAEETTTTSASTRTTLSSNSSSLFTDFDYNAQWYPVNWVHDVRPNHPTKVTLFDVDYVIAINKNKTKVITALQDQCPHKAAALSEGRIVQDTNYIQCAYHGWSFHGNTGNCIQIPQSATTTSYSKRYCAKSIPAIIHQKMIWLWPGPIQDTYPKPPTIPELDNEKEYTMTPIVREFPMIDWTLLVSNLLDPDHGIFAHQAPFFDWYTATSKSPQIIEQSFPNNKTGWILNYTVPATYKLLEQDRIKRGKKNVTSTTKSPPRLATSIFYAPTTVTLSRRNPTDDKTPFVFAFWVCPVGTGRSKFFSCGLAKVPKWVKIPRWLIHMFFNRFLDQDTVLVASQQSPVLLAEVHGKKRNSQLYNYASPTDKAVRLIDRFWDMTTWKVPNRNVTLQQLNQSGVLQNTQLKREFVLDRKMQHLDICPDSQDTVRNCKILRNISYIIMIAWVSINALIIRQQQSLLKTKFKWIPIVSLLAGLIFENVRKRFYYDYPEWKRNRDLKRIPSKIWIDPK